MTENTKTVRLYLPENISATHADMSADDVRDNVRADMAEHGGGWTEWTAEGGWDGPNGLVREPVRVFECAVDEHAHTLARHLTSMVKIHTDEDVVLADVRPCETVISD